MTPDLVGLAERYAREICENINNYCIGICDWNLLLDSKGGPYHHRFRPGTNAIEIDYKQNNAGCYAPIMFNENEKSFECNKHNYAVTRFLCILKNVQETQNGWYDISVVESQIGERLTDNESLIGVEVLPIAELFAGDYVCLDYRKSKEKPSICVWSHEESEDFAPVTYKVADTFSEFVEMLG